MGAKNAPCVLVSHPHPLYGGSMNNNVVHTACRAACQAGLSAWRFNFRGVGQSEGVSNDARGEIEDLQNAADHVSPVALIGYSFGAWVITRAALDLPAILISPPTRMFVCDFSRVPGAHIIAGTEDDFCRQEDLAALPAGHVHIFPGVDHFWMDDEDRLEKTLADLLGVMGIIP